MLRHFLRRNEGSTILFFAFVLGTLVIAVGAAVDITRAFLVRSKVQEAVDSAVMAASLVAGEDAEAQDRMDRRAQSYFAENFPLDYMGATATMSPVTYNTNTGEVDGTASVTVPMVFGGFLGLDTVEISRDSQTTRKLTQNLEISLVVDVSDSMCESEDPNDPQLPVTGSTACPPPWGRNPRPILSWTCRATDPDTKINALVFAIRQMVNVFNAQPRGENAYGNEAKVYYALIPFNSGVKISDRLLPQDIIRFYDRIYDSHGNDTGGRKCTTGRAIYTPNVLGLTDDGESIYNALKDHQIRGAIGTNSAIGTLWGWVALQATGYERFGGEISKHHTTKDNPYSDDGIEGHPSRVGDTATVKALIMLGDGRNTDLTGGNRVDEDHRDLCIKVKDEGIQIYSIMFGVRPVDQVAYPQWQACAENSGGKFYTPNSRGALAAAFRDIANTLAKQRISR